MSENDGNNRRNVLKSFGLSLTGATVGFASMSGTAAARYPVDTNSGEIDDPDWDDYEEYTKNNTLDTSSAIEGPGTKAIYTPSSISIPNPVDLGFNVCGDWGDGKLCLDASGQAQTQYYDCAGKYIRTVSFTMTKQTLDIYGNYQVDFQQSAWVGMDESNCLYVGIEAAGQDACTSVECPWDPNTSTLIYSMRDELNTVVDAILQWLDNNSDVNYDVGSPTEVVATAVLAALLFLAFVLGGLTGATS